MSIRVEKDHPAVQPIKKYAPAAFGNGFFYAINRPGGWLMFVVGHLYLFINLNIELSIKRLILMERYHKCQTGQITNAERETAIRYKYKRGCKQHHHRDRAVRIADDPLFHGCKITIHPNSIVADSGWWKLSFGVREKIDAIIDRFKTRNDEYSEIVSRALALDCIVVYGVQKPYIVHPAIMPMDDGRRDGMLESLEYEPWRKQVIGAINIILPLPIAEEICDHV
jgi:hypothetical protein